MNATTVFPSLRTPEGIARAIRRGAWFGTFITLSRLLGFQKVESPPEIITLAAMVLFYGVLPRCSGGGARGQPP